MIALLKPTSTAFSMPSLYEYFGSRFGISFVLRPKLQLGRKLDKAQLFILFPSQVKLGIEGCSY